MSRNFGFSVDEYYHLYNRGTDKRIIFPTKKDYDRFLSLMYLCNSDEIIHRSDFLNLTNYDIFNLKRGKTIVDIGVHCLMPNHFHILVREKTENGISNFMQKVSTAYTMYFNKKYDRSGALFEGRFRAKHALDDNYLKYLYSYIHLNPIKIIEPSWKVHELSDPGKAKSFLESYRYSSYPDYQKVDRPQKKILNTDAFPGYFNEPKKFEEFITDWLSIHELHVKVEP